CLQELRTPFTF
nr:immunoglobulin light chain junction region [Macaca mulatta]